MTGYWYVILAGLVAIAWGIVLILKTESGRTGFDKLKLKFGYLNNERVEQATIMAYADLPSLDVLRAKLLGLFSAPASRIAQVIKAKSEKAE